MMQDGGTILLRLWQYRFWPLTDERLVSCEEQSNVNVSTLRRLNCRTQVQYYCVCDKYRFWPLTDARFISFEEQSNVNVPTLRRRNSKPSHCYCRDVATLLWTLRTVTGVLWLLVVFNFEAFLAMCCGVNKRREQNFRLWFRIFTHDKIFYS